MSENITTIEHLRLASSMAKVFTSEQIVAITEALEGFIKTYDEALEKVEEHVNSPHAPANAEENVIVSIKANGEAVPPVDKIIDIKIPVKLSDLIDDLHLATVASMQEIEAAVASKAEKVHKHVKAEITDFPTSMTPTSHAASTTAYGKGDATNYGHLRLSASVAGTGGEADGVAATPSAVKSAYDLAKTTSATAADLTSRVKLLEMILSTDVSGNPYYVTFESISGLSVTGVWNQANGRIEF